MNQKGFTKTELSSSWEFNLQMTIPKRHSCLSWHLHSYSTSISLAHTCPLQASSCWISNPKLARHVRKNTSNLPNRCISLKTMLSEFWGIRNLNVSAAVFLDASFMLVQKCPTILDPTVEESNSRGHDTSHPGDDQKGICLLTKTRHLKKECSC